MDQLFASSVTEVFAQAARQALKKYWIEHSFYHLESTSFHLHGQYSAQEPELEAADPCPIEISYGDSEFRVRNVGFTDVSFLK
jgi:hypothetical protein